MHALYHCLHEKAYRHSSDNASYSVLDLASTCQVFKPKCWKIVNALSSTDEKLVFLAVLWYILFAFLSLKVDRTLNFLSTLDTSTGRVSAAIPIVRKRIIMNIEIQS